MKSFFLISLMSLICSSFMNIYAQHAQKNILLNEIQTNINNYKNKEITLKLRLKNIDPVFDKITFYDRKNIDIVFDISELKRDIRFQKQALNLHPGLEYMVIFIVKEVLNTGYLTGDLKSFEPFILRNLPEKTEIDKKIKKAE